MYQRFLNNEDYMSQISDEQFNQLIRGQQIRVKQAEEATEASIVEYLTDNYEVEKALEVGKNLREYNSRITYPVGVHFYHDPRNSNIKKYMVRIALYELHKLISPNNVSTARITDYEVSMRWLRDANRYIINPQIQRKLDEENKPVSKIAMATFQRDHDPYKNPWQI